MRDGQRIGPVTQADFDRLVAEGVITSETMVWQQGMANWLPYGTVSAAGTSQAVPVGAGAGAEDDTAVCAVSGERHPKRDMLQYEGTWISARHRDAYFQRLREGVPQALEGKPVPGPLGYASFGRRFAARLIDGVIMWVVQVVIGALLAMLLVSGATTPSEMQALQVQLIVMAVGMACYASYDALFVAKLGATPGKMALGIKVLRPDGGRLSIARGFGRYFGQWASSLILCIGYLMMLWDDENRTLHDRLADSRVIRSRQ